MKKPSWSNNDEVKDLKNTSAEIDIKVAHFSEAKKFTETKEWRKEHIHIKKGKLTRKEDVSGSKENGLPSSQV